MTNKFLLFILLLLASLNSALAQTKISLITEDYRPPLNMIIDNKIVGISTEIMQELMKREKIEYTLEALPWARGFNTTQKKSDTALFSTTRTPEREKLFKWVGPIISNNWVFFAKKGSKIKINSLDDAKKYSIGVYTEDAVTEFLQKNGFVRNENLDVSTNDQQNALKLQAGRIDLWASGSALGPWIVKLANAGRIEELYTFNKTELYAAFNINTDDKIINQLNKQLKKMKQDGTVKKIYNKYFYQK
jgi:polar amino acid transport system substrate-binding protein